MRLLVYCPLRSDHFDSATILQAWWAPRQPAAENGAKTSAQDQATREGEGIELTKSANRYGFGTGEMRLDLALVGDP